MDDTGGIISYEDACDRVGRELFGDDWDITLSDDEWSEYDAGQRAASSTIAYWDAAQNHKDRAMSTLGSHSAT